MARPALVQRGAPRPLPAGVIVADVADLSRLALVAFLRLDHSGVAERAELALWLFGPYLDALSIGHTSLLGSKPSLAVDDVLPGDAAASTIASATRAIERVLCAFHERPDPTIATRLLEHRIVETVIDDHGGSGFGPLGAPWMPLNVRVLALAAAEMLTRPDRLRAELVVGPSSIEIADRPVASGVGLRSRQTLPWTPSRDERERAPGWPASAAPTLAELVAAQDRDDD